MSRIEDLITDIEQRLTRLESLLPAGELVSIATGEISPILEWPGSIPAFAVGNGESLPRSTPEWVRECGLGAAMGIRVEPEPDPQPVDGRIDGLSGDITVQANFYRGEDSSALDLSICNRYCMLDRSGVIDLRNRLDQWLRETE